MGVSGLLPLLKEIQEPCTLERYRGKTLAIDGFGWMHRALISCSQDLCLNRPTRRYITAVTNKLKMLRHFGIEPYIVFDGAPLPTKADTNSERRQRREEARKKADAYVALGDSKLAWKEFMKAASVTFEMVKSVMVELDVLGIKYVVAPYEADPQMVYMEKIGLVDGILSEDSDLLVFGCRVLITKLKDNGTCVEVNRDNFPKLKSSPFLRTISQEHLRLLAMIAGCDYTKGLANVGMKKAINFISKYTHIDKILLAMQTEGNVQVPIDFKDELYKADLAFRFQKVFDPRVQELTTLTEYPETLPALFEELETCCGRCIPSEVISDVANGHLHPISHEILVSREQSLSLLKSHSVVLTNSTRQVTSASAVRSISMTSKPNGRTIDTFFKKDVRKVKIETNSSVLTPTMLSASSSVSLSLSVSASSVLTASTSTESFETTMRASPTRRKLDRFNVDLNGTGEKSLFFPKPKSAKDEIASSPVKRPRIEFSDTHLDELTDDESEDGINKHKQQLDSVHNNHYNVPSSDDLDIEESPVKTTGNLQAMEWRKRFQFDSASASATPALPIKRPALASKNVNVIRPKLAASKIKKVAPNAAVVRAAAVVQAAAGPVTLDPKKSSTVKLHLFAYRP